MKTSRKTGFTLVEVLVAMAILSILVAIIGTVFSSATQSVTAGTSHLESDSEARLVFDRMADDFDNMLKRTDVDYIFAKEDGNDKMFFFSHAPGYTDVAGDANASSTSLVGYRVNPNTLQLERLGKQLEWSPLAGGGGPGSIPYLTYVVTGGITTTNLDPAGTIEGNWGATVGAAPTYDGVDADYHALGDGVFRMEFCFLQATSPATNPPTSPYIDPPAPVAGTYPFQTVTTGATPVTTTVKGIVVTIAVLEKGTRRSVPDLNTGDSNTTTEALMNSLPDVANTPPLEKWTTTINSPTYAQSANLPVAVGGHVRVYQHTFYLDVPPSVATQ
jgi:prepilin-type N-terminal cleavage/methylation domain-containing protein